MTIRFGLVGCGKIANRHASLLGYGEVNGGLLAAVCDVDIEKAKSIGLQFNVPYFSDMTEMLQTVDLDCVSVLTGSGYHAENTLTAAQHGKHVVVEKPMAMDIADADKMIAYCANAGVKLFVVKQNRFNAPVQRLRSALEEGRFGKLVLGTVRVRWARHQEYYDQAPWRGTKALDGGVLMNQASHHIDLLSWMMGDVESVQTITETALARIEVEDTAVAIIRFSNGALGVIEATTASRPSDLEGSLSIMGEGGSVIIGGYAANQLETWSFVDSIDSDSDVFEVAGKNPDHPFGYAHARFYDHVVRALKENHNSVVDGVGGRVSLKLIEALYLSAETGEKVYLD